MVENEETTMMEEGEDILDGLESMLTEDGSGVTEDVLIDATECFTGYFSFPTAGLGFDF